MELGADAWHQDEEGNYYIDCPECGSAATVSNVTNHGRCNGYLDEVQSDTDLDEQEVSCTAVLTLELTYTSDPDETAADPHVTDDTGEETTADAETDEAGDEQPTTEGAVSGEDAPGVSGTVSDEDSSD